MGAGSRSVHRFRPGNVDAYKLMYVTTGVRGDKQISTGVLMIPRDGRSNADRTLIGYQMANDSVGGYCHPSTMWTGGDPEDGASWSALGPLAQMFGKGMAGGVGAAFAAEQAAEYAPELNIKATVLEGMVINERSFMRVANGSVGSGFAFATLLGLEPSYPEMKLDEKLSPLGEQVADYYRTQCQTPADIPGFKPVFDDNLLGTRAPKSKVLVASCAKDDSPMSLVPAADARKLVDDYRAGGTDVSYQPTDCSMTRMLTDLYGWGTDLFGMQTVDWLAANTWN